MNRSGPLVTIPPVPPTGPARVAWYQQVREAIAADAHRVFGDLIDAGWSNTAALEVVNNGMVALDAARDEVVHQAVTIARWAA